MSAKKGNEKILALTKSAKRATAIDEHWEGIDVNSLTEDKPEKFDITSILGVELIVIGYSEREGNKGDFLIIGVIVNEQPGVVVCGGKVVIKKMRKIAESNQFPCTGYFLQPKGKDYYDFIS